MTDSPRHGQPGVRRSRALLHRLDQGRLWFRAWRRTRPFWGGLWAVLGGLEIIKLMSFTLLTAVSGGWNYSAGYILGGGMALFGLVAWFAPHYKTLCGIAVFLIALFAFPTANLGGLVLGTVLGILGGSMIWAWGEKRPSRRDRRGAAAANR